MYVIRLTHTFFSAATSLIIENGLPCPETKRACTTGECGCLIHSIAYPPSQWQPLNNTYAHTHPPHTHEHTCTCTHTHTHTVYSWDIGPAHIISINTEFYFFLWDGLRLIDEQFHWLEENLKRANEPTQRAKRPWIITMYHQPMYCTTVNNEDCNHHESVVSLCKRVRICILSTEIIIYKYWYTVIAPIRFRCGNI